MTSRERVLSILNHKEADRVPLDLGAGKCCKFHRDIYKKVTDYFGIKENLRICAKPNQSALASDELLEKLESDVRVPFPVFQKNDKSGKEWEDDKSFFLEDSWGTVMRMPKEGGLYYDMVKPPLAGHMDDDALEYNFPSLPLVAPEAVEQAKKYQAAGYPVLLPDHFGNCFVQAGPRIFGYEDWLMMLVLEDKKAIEFMDRLLEAKIRFWDNVAAAFGDSLDIVCESDDLGTQNAPFISPELYRKLIKPYHKKLFDHIHKRMKAKIFLHCCGSIIPMIPELIDVGLDILNPVQINAAGMDPVFLKKEFGRDLTFWGGGVDTQKVLPYGTPQEVRGQVKRNIEIFSKDGGFVFAAVHNIQSNVPLENVIAMWEAYKEFRVY
jgi:uroporphyrinogen decarboxylase